MIPQWFVTCLFFLFKKFSLVWFILARWSLGLFKMQEETLALRKEGIGVVLDSELPHLIGIDDDLLSTGIILYHLKVRNHRFSLFVSGLVWGEKSFKVFFLNICFPSVSGGSDVCGQRGRVHRAGHQWVDELFHVPGNQSCSHQIS